jgi:hypothetical protein
VKISADRIVAFVGPYIGLVAAAVAAWLVAKLNVLGLPGLDEKNTETFLAAALTFGIAAGLHALGSWQWLKGRHIEIANATAPVTTTVLVDGKQVAENVATVAKTAAVKRRSTTAKTPAKP